MAPPRERELELDLESGRKSNHEDQNAAKELIVLGKRQVQTSLTKVLLGILSFARSIKRRNGFGLFRNLEESGKVLNENLELVIDRNPKREEISSQECLCLSEKYCRKGECKNINTNSKKANSKPPRPPKGPSLDAFDRKLVREIVQLQLARRKQAISMERMKASKKMKSAKASNVFTKMIITIAFLVIVIFK